MWNSTFSACWRPGQATSNRFILPDFSKTVDKVSHPKLMIKCSLHRVKENTLKWIGAFPVGRTQAVGLERENSSEVPMKSGVTRGSVLGPLLVLLYIKDLPQNAQAYVGLFVDDIKSIKQLDPQMIGTPSKQSSMPYRNWSCVGQRV